MSGLVDGGLDQEQLGCRRKRRRRCHSAAAVQNGDGLAGRLGLADRQRRIRLRQKANENAKIKPN